jgi:Rrf2 family transcriptional regulator, iron-sulfur cluster assembly transcription factor
MNFSKTTSYSLTVLSYMAVNADEKMSAKFLHEKLSIPYPYLRQVLTKLSHHGFIKSTRGRSGGFTFRKPKENISIADIIDATDGLESLNNCILGFNKCPFDKQCAMHKIWGETRSNILKVLKETSLSDIVR